MKLKFIEKLKKKISKNPSSFDWDNNDINSKKEVSLSQKSVNIIKKFALKDLNIDFAIDNDSLSLIENWGVNIVTQFNESDNDKEKFKKAQILLNELTAIKRKKRKVNFYVLNIKLGFDKPLKERSIKSQFVLEMLQRSRSEEWDRFLDFESNTFVLVRNPDETIEFLRNATIKEIAWAFECIEEISLALPLDKAEIALTIFQDKLDKFPIINDISEVVVSEELEFAICNINERKKQLNQ